MVFTGSRNKRGQFQRMVRRGRRNLNRRARGGYGRIPKSIQLKSHIFSFNQSLGTIENNTVGFQSGALTFTLGQITDNSHVTGLFDQYRIRKVIITFIPRATEMAVSQPSTGSGTITKIPLFITAKDMDGTSAPTSILTLREHSQNQETASTKQHKWAFKPAVLGEIYRSGVSTNYSTKYDQWLDTSTTDIPHYGLNYFMEAGGSLNSMYTYEIKSVYIVECKAQR